LNATRVTTLVCRVPMWVYCWFMQALLMQALLMQALLFLGTNLQASTVFVTTRSACDACTLKHMNLPVVASKGSGCQCPSTVWHPKQSYVCDHSLACLHTFVVYGISLADKSCTWLSLPSGHSAFGMGHSTAQLPVHEDG
jgi:hypothetical protein